MPGNWDCFSETGDYKQYLCWKADRNQCHTSYIAIPIFSWHIPLELSLQSFTRKLNRHSHKPKVQQIRATSSGQDSGEHLHPKESRHYSEDGSVGHLAGEGGWLGRLVKEAPTSSLNRVGKRATCLSPSSSEFRTEEASGRDRDIFENLTSSTEC